MPEDLPQCNLISQLNERLNEKHNVHFNYFHQLDEFRKRVTGELRYINLLFPEWTPHDEEYHIKNLFVIADSILDDTLKRLNLSELIVLALSLYGHDWGMAVSADEKEYILTGKVPEGRKDDEFCSLEKEIRTFNNYLKTVSSKNLGELSPELKLNIWREYVRTTHAFRSGERIRKYFDPVDNGVAEAVAKVCEGHALPFEDLDDEDAFSVNFSVLGESVNLRALAVYLRLIDLFDLSANRTPYVLWKFVWPRDPTSQMSWKKHRSLQQITCPPYQTGRVIKVDGYTGDQDVFAELEDLKNYCELELRKCNDILARMNASRYNLDIFHVEWHVVPRDFDPISIKFEFDRLKMFEILSSEIYDNNPNIFLRELLQNSIDAIRMREEILLRKKMSFNSITPIRVNVEHKENGDAIVTWEDDGIGMDESVLKNYFSVVGNSYYRSSDFQKIGLTIDPISKYGIGILSCFQIANKIEITTFKDPYFSNTSNPLIITIPDVTKQFRIEKIDSKASESYNIGTKIKIFVSGLKIKKNTSDYKRLHVISYLKKIAGFTEYPIFVTEDSHKVILLNPSEDIKSYQEKFGKDWDIIQYNTNNQFSDVFLPQDLKGAIERFSQISWDIEKDLHVDGYEGKISFFIPKNDKIQLSENASHVFCGTKYLKETSDKEDTIIRWNEEWSDHDLMIEEDNKLKVFAVFSQGILLPKTEIPWALKGSPLHEFTPRPKAIINIKKLNCPTIDISRSSFSQGDQSWYIPISLGIIKKVLDDAKLSEINDNMERWLKIGSLFAFYPVENHKLLKNIPLENIVIPVLEKGGNFEFIGISQLSTNTVYRMPQEVITCFEKIIIQKVYLKNSEDDILRCWQGDNCVLLRHSGQAYESPIVNESLSVSSTLLKQKYLICDSVRFLHPLVKNASPLLQHIHTQYNNEKINMDNFFDKCERNPDKLTPVELYFFSNEFVVKNPFTKRLFLPGIYNFSTPYEKYFAYNHKTINYLHPFAQEIIRIAVKIHKMSRKTIPPDKMINIGRVIDAFNSIFSEKTDLCKDETKESFKKAIISLINLTYDADLISQDQKDRLLNMDYLLIVLPHESVEDCASIKIKNAEVNPNFGKMITEIM